MIFGSPWTLLGRYHRLPKDTLQPLTRILSQSLFMAAWGKVSATLSCTSSTLWPGSGNLSLWVCCKHVEVLQFLSDSQSKKCFNFCGCSQFRQKEIFPICHITLQFFIRKSFLSLAESSRAILLGINPAVMLCTSSTRSLNSGTSPL